MSQTNFRHKVGLILFGILLAVVLLEIGLRLAGSVYLYLQEKSNLQFAKGKEVYRILCVGESTTALGDEFAYPNQLEKILNARSPQRPFLVFNKGVPGTNSTDILADIEDNLDTYRPDMVIVMMGINDADERQPDGEAQLQGHRILDTLRIINVIRWTAKAIREHQQMRHVNSTLRSSDTKPAELIRLAEHYRTLRRFDIVEKLLVRTTELEPDNGALHMELAAHYWDRERLDDAIRILELASSKDLAYRRRLELAAYYRKLKQFDVAEKQCQRAIQMNPEREEAYVQWAAILLDSANDQRARNVLQKIWDVDPQLDADQMEMVVFYYLDGERVKAREILTDPIDRYSEDAEDLVALGSRYWERRKLDKAVEIYEQVRQMQPEHTIANTRLLQYMTYHENPDKAEHIVDALWQSPRANQDFLRIYTKLFDIDPENKSNRTHRRRPSMEQLWTYSDQTKQNYRRMARRLQNRNIQMVVMQYPMRDIAPLQAFFSESDDVLFISNEDIFKQAVRDNGYAAYFEDLFAGDFGHCTRKGNRMLSENAADHILAELP